MEENSKGRVPLIYAPFGPVRFVPATPRPRASSVVILKPQVRDEVFAAQVAQRVL